MSCKNCYITNRKIKDSLEEIKNKYSLLPYPRDGTKKLNSYKGICLTARSDSRQPLYDGLKLYFFDN